ncbi:hypothetical protein MAR_013803, partial [Mya arenaria]
CSPQNEAVFKEAIVRRMHVDKAMLEIPQVKEWYKKKFLLGRPARDEGGRGGSFVDLVLLVHES